MTRAGRAGSFGGAAVTLRPAVPRDARAIAEVHIAAWRAAYRGLLPDAVLDRLDVNAWAAQRRARLADPPTGKFVTVATIDERIIAFCSAGPSRDGDAPQPTAEVQALYVTPAWWRRGVGTLLLDRTIAAFRDLGYATATLWVLAGNDAARRFYRQAGWLPDGSVRDLRLDGAVVAEARYARRL